MTEKNWQVLIEIPGEIQAEILRGLLEAQGISSTALFSSNSAYPINPVQVLVAAEDLPQAQAILENYFEGEFGESPDSDQAEPDQG